MPLLLLIHSRCLNGWIRTGKIILKACDHSNMVNNSHYKNVNCIFGYGISFIYYNNPGSLKGMWKSTSKAGTVESTNQIIKDDLAFRLYFSFIFTQKCLYLNPLLLIQNYLCVYDIFLFKKRVLTYFIVGFFAIRGI